MTEVEFEKKLDHAESLWKRGKLSEAEYQSRRAELFKQFDAAAEAGAGGAKGVAGDIGTTVQPQSGGPVRA